MEIEFNFEAKFGLKSPLLHLASNQIIYQYLKLYINIL